MAFVRRNTVNVYLHIVWATYQRHPLVVDSIEKDIYRCIEDECRKTDCQVLAIGGMPDHIHLAVSFPTTISIAKLVQQVKGVSSSFGRARLGTDDFFGWQEGYGVFSFSRAQSANVIDYILNQKPHHATNNLWPTVENIPTWSDSPQSGTGYPLGG